MRAAAAFLLASACLAHAVAAQTDDTAVPLSGPGWVILHVEVDGPSEVRLRSWGVGGTAALALAFEGEVRVAGNAIVWLNNTGYVYLDAAGSSAYVRPVRASEGRPAAVLLPEPGSYEILLIGAGKNLTKIEYELKGAITGTEIARGSGAVFEHLSDFHEGAQVAVGVEGVAVAAGAARTRALDVENGFFGWFGIPLLPAHVELSYARGPAGERDCPCWFFDRTEGAMAHAEAGAWSFDWNGAYADLHAPVLFGADVQWPS